MNRFLLRAREPTAPEDSTRQVPRFGEAIESDVIRLGPGLDLYLPKCGASDICTAIQQDESVLILSGYLTEAPGVSDASDQEAVCERTREAIADRSDEADLKRIVSNLNGSFGLVFIDRRRGEILTITDRIASRPLWHSRSDDALWISSESLTIVRAADARFIDLGGLASFLLYGTQIEPTKCIFKGLVSQNEGTIWCFQNGKEASKSRWYRFRHEPIENRSLNDWLDCTAERLLGSARRTLSVTPTPPPLLEWGRRFTPGGICPDRRRRRPPSVDVSRLRESRGSSSEAGGEGDGGAHEVILRDSEHYLRVLPNAAASCNGSHLWTHSHFSAAFAESRERLGISGAFLGDFCEAFSKLLCEVPASRTAVWTDDEFVRSFDDLFAANYGPKDRSRTLELLQPDVRALAEEGLTGDLSRRFAQARCVSSELQIILDYFFRWQRASCIATFQMFHDLRSVGPERNIMFDRGVRELLEVLPASVRSKSRLGTRLVARFSPKAARVADANTLLPLYSPGFTHSVAKAARPVLGKLRRKLFSNTYETTASWPHLPLLMQKDAAWRKHIEELIHEEDLLPSSLFDHDVIEDCWRRFGQGDLSRHDDMEKLVGIAWIQKTARSS